MVKVILHYAEISIKGKNRSEFEKILKRNIVRAYQNVGIKIKINQEYGRLIFEVKKKEDADLLSYIPGVSNYSIAEECKKNIEDIQNISRDMLKTFKGSVAVVTKRSDKKFPINSIEMNKKIGSIATNLGLKINLKEPDNRLTIEIAENNTYIYSEKVFGLGGLPIGSGGRMLSLLSGGVDSPVAAFQMMKRGCIVDFIHFHTYKKNEEVLSTKIKLLIDKLNRYQISSRLFLVPYHNYQINTLGKIDPKIELVIFRNFMLRLSQKIARDLDYDGLVTGDSLSQVASQTPKNILAATESISFPIYRPLISFDKEEIIAIAKKIDTHDLSIANYKDCCSIMAKSPYTKASLDKTRREIEKIDMDNIIEDNYKKLESFVIK